MRTPYRSIKGVNVENNSNVKVFNLESTSDLTNAQAAYDWYLNGGVPIIKYSNSFYVLSVAAASVVRFTNESCSGTNNYGYWTIIADLTLSLSSNTVTSVSGNSNTIRVASSAPTSGSNDVITLVI